MSTRRRSRNQAPQPTLAKRPRDDVILAQSAAPAYAQAAGPFYTQQPVPVSRDVREDPYKATERQLKEVSITSDKEKFSALGHFWVKPEMRI